MSGRGSTRYPPSFGEFGVELGSKTLSVGFYQIGCRSSHSDGLVFPRLNCGKLIIVVDPRS